jgi:hypothetical protein
MKQWGLWLLGLMWALWVLPVVAQELPDEVWVTTQDFSSLRTGPGIYWERLAVVPPATTLRATGRTVQANWLQVEYGDQRGWIAAKLLIWTGDWMALPVDGVDPLPFVRRQEVIAGWQDAVYSRPSNRVEDQVTLPAGCEPEITGRLGMVLPMWVQFRCMGDSSTYYWSIAFNPPSQGRWSDLPNLANAYAYGRILEQIGRELTFSGEKYFTIRSLWRSLDQGNSVSCNSLPEPARAFVYDITDVDVSPTLLAAVRATETWISETNQAIALFTEVCSGANRTLSAEVVQQGIAHITAAERAAFFLGTLLEPLAANDPAFGGGSSG